MEHLLHALYAWLKQPDYKDPDEKLSVAYIQSFSLIIIVSAMLVSIVYMIEGQTYYVSMALLEVLIYSIVIVLVRLYKLRAASTLFLVSALALLSFGIFSSGGIHSSSSVLYPVILVFASLLLDRRSYIIYGLLCLISIGFIIYAENQGLTPVVYIPDPPRIPLFITYALVIIAVGGIIRSITESLQTSSRKARQFAQEIYTQKVMLDRVGQAVVGCGIDNKVIYWNQAAIDLYGWTEDEALGQNYYDLIPTALTHEMEDEIDIALRNGETWSGELVIQNKDRNELHVLATVAPLQDENGKITGWIGIGADLTERKYTEKALRLSEEKFSKAFHTTPVLMTIENADGQFVEVNNAFIEALGYSREEIIGRRPSELNLVPIPEDRDMAVQIQNVMDTFKDVELRIRRKSGEVAIVLMSVEYIHVNETRYILTSALDITERKRAEEKYRNIFNNSIEGIFQSIDDGHFLQVNPAMAHIYGYDSPEEMLNSVTDISSQLYTNSDQRDDVRKRLNSGERLVGYESLDYRKDGSTFWASMSIQAIRDENGEVLYYEGTVEDITRRKNAEAERETLIQELAKKNTELEQFTYTVSHDLKSPLVTINGFVGYLEQDAASGDLDRLKKDTRRIQEAVQKMQKLLSELLELSRIGRLMNPSETVPFETLVHEAMENVHGQLETRGVEIRIQPDLPSVYGDNQRLIEVLQNLVDNAAKYMGDQTDPQIEIGQNGEEDGKPIFFVKDNGMGIDPEYYERIFGLFNKLDAKSEGTGVGLALVKRIVEVHGGRIWVQSEALPQGDVGAGSTFYFTLPTGPSD